MSRKPRVQFPGAVYHVTSRGNDKQPIFLSDRDRLEFLAILHDVVFQFGWICHVFCLMGTHYHLVIETPTGNLSEGMHRLNSAYSHRFNDRHGRVGHVIQGRYFARLIEDDRDYFTLLLYIYLNPVKDGFSKRPEEWRWSSYRAVAGLARAPSFLEMDYTLMLFSDDTASRQASFIEFVTGGLQKASDDGASLSSIFHTVHDKQQRNEAILRAAQVGYSIREIADYLHIHRTTVYRLLKQ